MTAQHYRLRYNCFVQVLHYNFNTFLQTLHSDKINTR